MTESETGKQGSRGRREAEDMTEQRQDYGRDVIEAEDRVIEEKQGRRRRRETGPEENQSDQAVETKMRRRNVCPSDVLVLGGRPLLSLHDGLRRWSILNTLDSVVGIHRWTPSTVLSPLDYDLNWIILAPW